jgi:hypothetical protein
MYVNVIKKYVEAIIKCRYRLTYIAFTVLKHLPNTSVLFGDFSFDKRSQSDTVLEGYEPFLSDGYISLLGQNAHSKPIKILRDTGASQSLLLAWAMLTMLCVLVCV